MVIVMSNWDFGNRTKELKQQCNALVCYFNPDVCTKYSFEKSEYVEMEKIQMKIR